MKKSFMTRALATGLSLAMAFSLTAATNVTTAAAAAKPAMKASKMTVKEGKSKTFLATAKTLKTYKITKAKVKNASAKQYISVKKNAKGTGIVVTGKKGADTARKIVITFQNKKTKKTTNLTAKVVVKAVPQEEEKLTMTASVTGAKTIVAEFNKTIASPSAVKVTVKKGAANKDAKFVIEGSKITITTDTKLMAGTYTVSVEGVDTTAMTADVVVEKDETLTSYEISGELIADADASTKGSIYYKALNQYGEMMNADAPTVTCTFSSDKPEVAVTATATREGRIDVKNINTSLAIIGTKGNVILVDQTAGVNKTGEVVYSAAATAAEVKVDGLYNTAKSAFQDITAKDNAANYYLLMTILDQYGHQLSYKDIAKTVSITVAGGITNIENDTAVNSADTAKGLKDFTIGGKDYIAAVLKGTSATAGTATVTMVNNKRGLILTHTINVTDYVVLSNFVVSADNGIYNNQGNEMSFEATDKDGKAVTSYAVLSKLVAIPSNWEFQKKADGTAKLVYSPKERISSNASHTASTLTTAVFYLNENTSQNFKVKTQNFTVKQQREAVSVQGLAADATTQFSATVGKLSLDTNKIVFADQYANKVTKDDDFYPATIVTKPAVSVGSCGALIVTSAGMTTAKVSGSAFEFASTKESAYATVYLKYYNAVTPLADQKHVSETNYDYKFVVTCVDTQQIAASSIKITNVFGGNVEKVGKASSSAITEKDIEVKATVAGVETKLAPNQYIIKSVDNGGFTQEEQNKGVKTKTATVTIQATTFDSDNNPTVTELKSDYTISYDDAYATSIKEVSVAGKKAMASTTGAITTTGASLTAHDMQSLFTFKDQYGVEMTLTSGTAIDTHIAYTVVPKNTTEVKVYGENSNKVYATGTSGKTYLLTITATAANGKSVTKDFNVKFK